MYFWVYMPFKAQVLFESFDRHIYLVVVLSIVLNCFHKCASPTNIDKTPVTFKSTSSLTLESTERSQFRKLVFVTKNIQTKHFTLRALTTYDKDEKHQRRERKQEGKKENWISLCEQCQSMEIFMARHNNRHKQAVT